MNPRLTLTLTFVSACVVPLALACGAGGEAKAPPAAEGGASTGTGGAGVDNVVTGTGGIYIAPAEGGAGPMHPLFGAGNAPSVDSSDPCNSAYIWEVDVELPLATGLVVLYEGVLWQLTGTTNETWTLPDCTPPGTGWCATQYAWQQVGTCP